MKLFDDPIDVESEPESLGPGALVLRGFALPCAPSLLHALQAVAVAAPFCHMVTPGGLRMSVAMTNCGTAGWVTDRSGYRYDCLDPLSGNHWPGTCRLALRNSRQKQRLMRASMDSCPMPAS